MRKLLAILSFFVVSNLHAQLVINIGVNYNPPTCSSCCDGSFTVTLTGCTGPPFGFNFSGLPPGTILANNIIEFHSACSGTYVLTAFGGELCPSATSVFTLPFNSTGIENYRSEQIVPEVYPNPCPGQLTVESGLPNVFATVLDAMGNVLFNQSLEETNKTIDMSHIASGIYYLKLYSKGRLIVNQKVIKE